MNKVRTILQTIITALVLVLLPVVAFLMVSSRISVLGVRSFTVLSGSMEPYMHVGGVVFTFNSQKYSPFEVITFQKNDVVVTHRIVQIADNGAFITKGDANNTADSDPVAPRQVIGKVLLPLPYLGYIISFAKTVPGLITFIFIPTLLFVMFELKNIKGELEKEIEKKLREKIASETNIAL